MENDQNVKIFDDPETNAAFMVLLEKGVTTEEYKRACVLWHKAEKEGFNICPKSR